MLDFIKRIIFRGTKEEYSTEELRTTFKQRYRRFRSLLRANNQVLDAMAEIEEALEGTQAFGMNFVRERCVRISANVHRIIEDMDILAPGKYGALHERFSAIKDEMNTHVDPSNQPHTGPLTLSLAEIGKEQTDLVGAKMANLGEVRNKLGLKVPEGFVITAAGYERFIRHNRLEPEIDRRVQAARLTDPDELYALSTKLQHVISDSSIPSDLEEAILECYRSLEKTDGEGIRIAVRSSALGEDIHRATVAGQYHSVLNVSDKNILQAFKEVMASEFALGAMTYRLSLGIDNRDVTMCVGCMSMVQATSGGVMYSRNPLNIRDESTIINSVWGLPKPVVDGTGKVDSFIIARSDPPKVQIRDIPLKEAKYVCEPDEGVRQTELVGDQGAQASLSDEQAVELARLAIRIEEHYQTPQDTEWCIDENGSIVILQSRPLMQVDVSSQGSRPAPEDAAEDAVILRGGVTAAPGAAAGPVFIARRAEEILDFPDGGVLVVDQALPDWATVLNRAAAVVSEHGGIAGHLATVAREFGVPAIFSVSNATESLRAGDVVTVDADGLAVYEGTIYGLLAEDEKTAPNLMEGSPVYEALKGIAEHIVPLNLLDPDALSFKPENCKTFHDITRFCHEKSVQEMFNFGKDHHFPERSSKQLYVEAPMRWLVLNLDDGFKQEVEGKFVKLDNIISIPMLALWEGICSMPWAGPPPVDGKGMLSVMFHATQNTDLVMGTRSKYAEQQYFVISKNYCCLNMRLGFHFASVESMIGYKPNENYINFQFKGGAADFERRVKRIQFVKEILEGYHYKVDIKKDNLIARLEGYDKNFMIRNLKIIGYLAIHTRQLDMIMSNPAQVKHYMTKICKDIQDLFVGEKILYVYDEFDTASEAPEDKAPQPAEADPRSKRAEPAAAEAEEHSKILLVDDEREFVQTLSERLQMRDLSSAVAYDGEQALSHIDKAEPEVMILDLKMPGIDGIEVLRRVKKDHPNVEVIILTGHGTAQDEAQTREMGAFAFLEKPVDMETLAKTVREAYEKIAKEKSAKMADRKKPTE